MTYILVFAVLLVIAIVLIKKQKKKETQKQKIFAKNQVKKPSGKKARVEILEANSIASEKLEKFFAGVAKSSQANEFLLNKLSQENTCFVAVEANEIIGVIAWKNKNATIAQVLVHWVQPAKRKQKNGLRLLLKTLRQTRKQCGEIFLLAQPDDNTAFYKQFGFSEVKVSQPVFSEDGIKISTLPTKLRLNLNSWDDKKKYF